MMILFLTVWECFVDTLCVFGELLLSAAHVSFGRGCQEWGMTEYESLETDRVEFTNASDVVVVSDTSFDAEFHCDHT
jgi:hypothetical protein